MFYKLLILALCLSSTVAVAQVGITPITSAKGVSETPIDYTKVGAPMPVLRLLKFVDTTRKNTTDTAVVNKVVAKRKKKKNKKLPEVVASASQFGPRTILTNSDFNNGANLLIMMFNPNCSHCEDMTEMLEKNISLFNKSKIVLMASAVMYDYLPLFYRSFHIDEYQTITMGADSSDFISRVFLYSALPQMNIYNKERKLIKVFTGDIVIDSLRPYFQ